MATKHQKIRVKIGEGFDADVRQEIAEDLIDVMIARSETGKGVYGPAGKKRKRKFPAYTDAYTKKKGQSHVDLILRDEMLESMELLSDGPTTLTIGFRNGSKENAKADGNIRGTYGKQRASSKKARPFLGLTKTELNEVLKRHRSDLTDDEE